MSALVLGTAGHIDHGKSALVKALTGTDPDRLPEEKERGVTIELGFARLDLPSGRSMGVVDVPGHERFVRQMVAGATGLDVVLLVVAADDGVMPQTREHLAIIDLLGIPKGVVAITKSDLADPEWLGMVADDVTRLLEGTSIAGAPIVAVSSRTGAGLDELRAALDAVAGEAPARQATLPMRLPVDRVFTISGAGTVVTGTLWSGTAKRDDPVEVLPSGRSGRIRGVQVHFASVEQATAGQRVALNIAGLDKDEIGRGDVVAAPGTLSVTDRIDTLFTYLPGNDKPFESGTRVHVHHGTREVLGRVLLMDDVAQLQPGERAYAQIRLEEPLAPRYDDRFIVRSYSPVFTIGGGVVLDALPPRRTHLRAHERELLDALFAHDLTSAATGLLASRGVPMTSVQVAAALGVPRARVAEELNRAADLKRLTVGGDTYLVTADGLDRLISGAVDALLRFHEAHPKSTGLAAGALRDQVDRRVAPRVFDAVLDAAAGSGQVRLAGGEVRHPHAAAAALAEEDEALAALVPILESQGLSTGTVAELAVQAGVDVGVARKALTKLVAAGTVVRLGPDMHFAATTVDEARARITTHLEQAGSMLASDARDILGTSRKYIVPLLEYFDAQGFTKRDGDVRTLRATR